MMQWMGAGKGADVTLIYWVHILFIDTKCGLLGHGRFFIKVSEYFLWNFFSKGVYFSWMEVVSRAWRWSVQIELIISPYNFQSSIENLKELGVLGDKVSISSWNTLFCYEICEKMVNFMLYLILLTDIYIFLSLDLLHISVFLKLVFVEGEWESKWTLRLRNPFSRMWHAHNR